MTPRELALIQFIETRLDSMLTNLEAWGTPQSVEEGVLQLIEIRRVLLDPTCAETVTHEVMRAFVGFVHTHLQNATAEPLAVQLEKDGRIDRFAPLLRSFAEDDQTNLFPTDQLDTTTPGEMPAVFHDAETLFETAERAQVIFRQAVVASSRRRVPATPILFPAHTDQIQ